MADTSYDILFSGELIPGARQDDVRARLQELFTLTDQAADRLFGGRTIAVKRGVDHQQAVRFRDAFLQAGARVRLVERASGKEQAPSGDKLSLAPVNGPPLEAEPAVETPAIDISGLSLMPGEDWTLEDCDVPPMPAPVPDISHLRIVDPEPDEERSEEADDR
jgi:hypothetical protein